jgi:hypothetical protein
MVDLSLDSDSLRHGRSPTSANNCPNLTVRTHLAHGKECRVTRETADKEYIQLSKVLSQEGHVEPRQTRDSTSSFRCLRYVCFGRGCYAR